MRNDARPDLHIELMDLRAVTRPGVETSIQLDTGNGMKEWIRLGQICLTGPDGNRPRPWRLTARAKEGVTDFEHDSAYVLQIPLVGVTLEMVTNGRTCIAGWIAGEADDLHVPASGDYDPEKLLGVEVCEECAEAPHTLVPEGTWAGPRVTRAVWANLIGRRVEFWFGPARGEE